MSASSSTPVVTGTITPSFESPFYPSPTSSVQQGTETSSPVVNNGPPGISKSSSPPLWLPRDISRPLRSVHGVRDELPARDRQAAQARARWPVRRRRWQADGDAPACTVGRLDIEWKRELAEYDGAYLCFVKSQILLSCVSQ